MTLLKLIIITSLFCNGLKEAAGQGNILEWFNDYFYKKPKWIYKPIIGCIYCMSSIYSISAIGFYFLLYGFDINVLYLLPVMICCVCSLNGIIYNRING